MNRSNHFHLCLGSCKACLPLGRPFNTFMVLCIQQLLACLGIDFLQCGPFTVSGIFIPRDFNFNKTSRQLSPGHAIARKRFSPRSFTPDQCKQLGLFSACANHKRFAAPRSFGGISSKPASAIPRRSCHPFRRRDAFTSIDFVFRM